MIRLRDVTRVYATGGAEVHALAGVSLDIDRGESVAIMGQSGSGKSTLMNIIGLLDRPSAGHYLLAGRDVEQFSEDARSRLRGNAFGFVFQSYNLLPRLTALEQVELPLIYQRAPNRKRRAAEALVRVGGVVGIAIGSGVSLAVDGREFGGQELTMLIQPWSIAAAFLVAAGVGLASGSYPAYRATTVDPIAALRNE